MGWDPVANPDRMPQILSPIEESRDLAADMRGFTLNPEQLKKLGYQLEEYMNYDLMRIRRCKRCRLRIRSKARKCHPGLVRGGRFTCCNGRIFGPGCVSHDDHEDACDLDQMRKEWTLHETPPFHGVQREAIALDCEMGINRVGEPELIRVSAVDFYTGEVLIDSLVWPSNLMLHLNTRFSGVNWNMLYRAKESNNCIFGRDQARRRLWEFVGPLTIVITHGGCADMLALRWIHHRIIDTLELESRRADPESAPSLKNLSQIHLNRPIQQTRFGHDSLEDAMASRDLVKWYVDNLPAKMKKAVEMPVSTQSPWTALVEPDERERLGVEMREWLLVLGRIEV